jgi:hypothetical protein
MEPEFFSKPHKRRLRILHSIEVRLFRVRRFGLKKILRGGLGSW